MQTHRRSHAERNAATRAALLTAARELFGTRGFAAVGTEEIVRAAGVTRGALYHQFDDKTELFAAVFEALEAELAAGIAEQLVAAAVSDPVDALVTGAGAWLDVCAQPAVQRIVLLDAPSVLGHERFREIAMRYGLGLVVATLQAGIDQGRLTPRPVMPLAHVLIGALDEAALYIARSDDPSVARAEIEPTLGALIDGLVAS